MTARSFKTVADIERQFDAGYGSGDGPNYKPWLFVSDCPNTRGHKVWSQLCQREHQLLDDLQYRFFLMMQFLAKHTDLQETKPIPLQASMLIYEALKRKHPKQYRSSTPRVITTSFLLFSVDSSGRHQVEPISLIKESLLRGKQAEQTIAELEVNRIHWAHQNLSHKICTDLEINRTLTDNLETLVQATQVPAQLGDQQILKDVLQLAPTFDWTNASISTHIQTISSSLGVDFNRVMNCFKHLLWSKQIKVDLTQHSLHMAEPLWETPTFAKIALLEREQRRAA